MLLIRVIFSWIGRWFGGTRVQGLFAPAQCLEEGMGALSARVADGDRRWTTAGGAGCIHAVG